MLHDHVAPVDVRVTRFRGDEPVVATQAGELALLVQLGGRAEVTYGTGTVPLVHGDIVAFASGAGHRMATTPDSDVLALSIPSRSVPGVADAVAGSGGVLRAPDSPFLTIVVPFARHFADHVASIDGPAAQQLLRGAARMLAAALIAEPCPAPPTGTLSAVRSYIDDNLGARELTPAAVAAANYVSVRTLHALFSATGTTVSVWIRDRRLDACRSDLADDGCAHLTIAQIARARGLIDPAHFSRLFSRRFGVTPSAYRAGRHERSGDPAPTSDDEEDQTREQGGAGTDEAGDGAVCDRRACRGELIAR